MRRHTLTSGQATKTASDMAEKAVREIVYFTGIAEYSTMFPGCGDCVDPMPQRDAVGHVLGDETAMEVLLQLHAKLGKVIEEKTGAPAPSVPLTVEVARDIIVAEQVCEDEGIGPNEPSWRSLVTQACDVILGSEDVSPLKDYSGFEPSEIQRVRDNQKEQ